MSLQIFSTEEKPILLSGTEITLDSIYCRLEFVYRQDGTTIEATLIPYTSFEAFGLGKPVFTNVPTPVITIQLIRGEQFSIELIENKLNDIYTSEGYTCQIV